jgi:CDP-glucose 4,6-dehydratase
MGRKQSTLENMVNFNTLFEGIYKDKKVLLTGHTGFKGSWIALWLEQMGAKVYGFSLENEDDINHLSLLKLGIKEKINDIRSANVLEKFFQEVQPDIVFHLAAQALVRKSYDDPVETFSTNVMGTLNIFEACRKNTFCKSDHKCYHR